MIPTLVIIALVLFAAVVVTLAVDARGSDISFPDDDDHLYDTWHR